METVEARKQKPDLRPTQVTCSLSIRLGKRVGREYRLNSGKIDNRLRHAIVFTILVTKLLEHNKAEMHGTLITALEKIPSHRYSSCRYLTEDTDQETLRFLAQLRLWMTFDTETVIHALIYKKTTTGNSLGMYNPKCDVKLSKSSHLVRLFPANSYDQYERRD